MADTKDKKPKKPLTLNSPGKLELKKTVETGQVRQSFSHGRSKQVTVEVKRKRTIQRGGSTGRDDGQESLGGLSNAERDARMKALQDAQSKQKQAQEDAEEAARKQAESAAGDADNTTEVDAAAPTDGPTDDVATADAGDTTSATGADTTTEAETPPESSNVDTAATDATSDSDDIAQADSVVSDATTPEEPEAAPGKDVRAKKRATEDELARQLADDAVRQNMRFTPSSKVAPKPFTPPPPPPARGPARDQDPDDDRPAKRGASKPEKTKATPATPRRSEKRRRTGKLTITQALESGDGAGGERQRSLASVRRARERERQRQLQESSAQQGKQVREVTIPEALTVQELAQRMAEKGADVVKVLMKMGVMATITQTIDADTAELVVAELGHTAKRVSEADVEVGLDGVEDAPETLKSRPPVVTVMGHVDHGKTSLLDAIRQADVASREAGGITQHIGAYQVTLGSGTRISFLDTPGHEAFTQMRQRGAHVTDIVILVVAADDGIQPQTVEALSHAKAADVPMIIAINKIDLPGADPARVRQELLQHNIQVEEMGGDVLSVEVSAKKKQGLDKLEEAILLQSELLELKANPDRDAVGVVVEAQLERGRGPVATVLVQKGTLAVGDIFVVGTEWGRVRALVNDRGAQVKQAGPSEPVEVLGLNGTPSAGDDFVVVESEARAREISEYRQNVIRKDKAAAVRGSMEQMFAKIASGEKKELPVVVKGDVQGSVEAIVGMMEKLSTDEVAVRVLHSGVGGVNESDVTLADASEGMIIAFNVRANAQAREAAQRDGLDIRYYSVIYDINDDLKGMLSGMLAPEKRENFLGYAEILEIFKVSKVGNIAGCKVTEGMVRRGAGVRLLRDDVVVHEGTLSTLKRFKDEVKEVRGGMECGMAFENYNDIKVGDRIECYEVEMVARTL